LELEEDGGDADADADADAGEFQHHAGLDLHTSMAAKSRWKKAGRNVIATTRFAKPTRIERLKEAVKGIDKGLKSGRTLNSLPYSAISWTCALVIAILILSLVVISSLQFMITVPYVLSEGAIESGDIRITESTAEGTDWPEFPEFGVQCCTFHIYTNMCVCASLSLSLSLSLFLARACALLGLYGLQLCGIP